MGVRACDKGDCTNVMCGRASDLGYICNECFEKLVEEFSSEHSSYGHPSNWSKNGTRR